MKQNKFDLVMDYIDANIHQNTDGIKKGIYNLIGYNSNTFGHCFSVLTNDTLFHYISERRMYFAGRELQNDLEKSICDIALDYGYSEQSAFTRAMKSFYKCTPNDVRKGKNSIPDNKFYFKDFDVEHSDLRTQRILRAIKNDENISRYNMELLFGLENAVEEYGFDFDTCCQIADLAERLEISPWRLIDQCFEMVLEEKNCNDGFSQADRVAIELGIETSEELEEICKYYDCKYYDLDSSMVKAYKESFSK